MNDFVNTFRVTPAFARHLQEYHDIIDFVNVVWGAALAYDLLTRDKNNPIPDIGSDDFLEALSRHADQLKNNMTSEKAAWLRLNEYRQLQCQMLHSKIVDNFITYLSDLIAAVYQAQPSLLKSQETVTTEFVLQHESMEEFVASLAEKRVHDLAYKGIKELGRTLSKGWGIELFPDEKELAGTVYAVEVRNIIVHNRAVINQVFLNRIQSFNLPIGVLEKGELYYLDVESIMKVLKFLLVSAERIDRLVSKKFNLYVQSAPEPKEPFKFLQDEFNASE